jgi:Spy/CpxP family protein refolding chaperone
MTVARNGCVSLVAGLALMIGASGTASAQGTAPRQRPFRPAVRAAAAVKRAPLGFMWLQLRGVRLTADQRQQLKAIADKYRPQVVQLRQELKAARKSQDPQALANAKASMLQLRRQVMTEATTVLTPEQKQQVEARQQALARRLARARK